LKREVFLLLFASLFCSVQSQNYIVNEDFLKTYDYVLKFEKEKAIAAIQQQKSKPHENLLLYYIESGLYFVEAFLSETNDSRKEWTSRMPLWESKFKSGNKQSPYYNYCIAQLYFQKGLLGLKFQEYIQAGLDIRKAARMLDDNYEKFPDFYIQYKELGLLHCFVGNIPDQLMWLTGIAGLTADIKGGEKKLKTLLDLSVKHKEFKFLQLETLLYYSTVMTVLYSDDKKLSALIPYLETVRINYSSSPIFIYISSSLYSHIGKNDRALKEVSRYTQNAAGIDFDYLYYLRGLYLLQKGMSEAKKYFQLFLKEFNGMHYIKSAYHKLAWCWLLEEDESQYDLYLTLAMNAGKAVNDADKQAMSEARSKMKPHPVLLKARLLCDGGYYDEALLGIQQSDSLQLCQNHDFCVELQYRKARIFHLQTRESRAISLYKTVIEMGSDDLSYFAANSALMLGGIYEKSKDFRNAEKYYKLCFELPFEEYRNSIQQKAKAGLQRIK